MPTLLSDAERQEIKGRVAFLRRAHRRHSDSPVAEGARATIARLETELNQDREAREAERSQPEPTAQAAWFASACCQTDEPEDL
jgi:hypothetical protein